MKNKKVKVKSFKNLGFAEDGRIMDSHFYRNNIGRRRSDIRLCGNSRKIRYSHRQGAALLVVLFIVMIATILSLGFLSRSDVEMACGENMVLRTQMDYLAESGLEHARGLILNPQEVSGEYWTGAEGLQIVGGSDDYYDVNIVQLGQCNYQITSSAYRNKGGERVGCSNVRAELRLDPCIAFWAGLDTTIASSITINGDGYCNGNLTNNGNISGDVFATNLIGSIDGQLYPKEQLDVNWPGLEVSDFSSQYYYDGSGPYSVQQVIDSNYSDVSWGLSPGNPAGIYYHNGDLELEENVIINGTLVVSGKLIISGTGNAISAVKNFPAIIIGGHLDIKKSAGITVKGLIQSEGKVHIKDDANNAVISITGGLFVHNEGFHVQSSSFTMTITAAPAIASIQIWPTPGTPVRWSPAGGAFFRSIGRIKDSL